MPETKIVEITQAQLWELLLHGAIYEEANDTERHVALRCEVDGTLRTFSLQVGRGADGREHVFLVDTGGIQWTHSYENYQIVNPVLMTNAEADLFNPGGVAGQLFAVEFNVVNIDNANPYVIITAVGHAVGGGALAANEYILRDDSLPIRGETGWMGPYVIQGNDTIRGNAAALNDCVIHFRVRRADIGA